jgi:aconitate hydratase 2/2-methylisocitrate dehydratase
VIHSWLNRMLLPDTVGTGGDSHTRFLGGHFVPGRIRLVAFAAATGVMPLDMPESVLVRFKGECSRASRCVTWSTRSRWPRSSRALLDRPPSRARRTSSPVHPRDRSLPHLKVDRRSSCPTPRTERSAAAARSSRPGADHRILTSNITLLKWMIAEGYADPRSLARRIKAMEAWLANPQLLEGDADADYAAVIESRPEPIVRTDSSPARTTGRREGRCPTVAVRSSTEVFIGSCMTNIGHFRRAAKLLERQARHFPRACGSARRPRWMATS